VGQLVPQSQAFFAWQLATIADASPLTPLPCPSCLPQKHHNHRLCVKHSHLSMTAIMNFLVTSCDYTSYLGRKQCRGSEMHLLHLIIKVLNLPIFLDDFHFLKLLLSSLTTHKISEDFAFPSFFHFQIHVNFFGFNIEFHRRE